MHTSTPFAHKGSQRYTIPCGMNISMNNQSDSHLSGAQVNMKKRNKPLMEKRRRQRINHALEELRKLIIEPRMKHSNKLEKADILDMTVKFIRELSASDIPGNCHCICSETKQTENIHTFLYGYLSCETAFKYSIQKILSKQQSTNGSESRSYTLSSSSSSSPFCNLAEQNYLSVISEEMTLHKQSTISRLFNMDLSSLHCPSSPFITKQKSLSDSSNSTSSMIEYSPRHHSPFHCIELHSPRNSQVHSAMSEYVFDNETSISPSYNSSLVSNETGDVSDGKPLWRPW
ncbi:unnamed protein product [Heterobilharzia americana]|nr:unnamed protein product [Heterobilharzia americana]